jgi:hypothetical protein
MPELKALTRARTGCSQQPNPSGPIAPPTGTPRSWPDTYSLVIPASHAQAWARFVSVAYLGLFDRLAGIREEAEAMQDVAILMRRQSAQ